MKILRYPVPHQAEIVTVPDLKPGNGEFVTQSLFCDISAGTEMGFYRGTAPQFGVVCNAQGNFDDHADAIAYPMQSDGPDVWWMGYSNVSRVIAIGPGVTTVHEGDIIYSQTPHKTQQIFTEYAGYWQVPEGVDPRNAALTTMTSIALNGILDSGIRLMEDVVISGCGTLGILVTALAVRSGARVIAMDTESSRLEAARQAGATEVIDITRSQNPAAEVFALTGNRGADLVIEVSGNINALSTAMRAAACCARVVCLSFYPDGAPHLNLGREFHHKHINLISSQICSINPALIKWWDRNRLIMTAMRLAQDLNVRKYVSRYFGFDELPEALALIDRGAVGMGKVCIDYSKEV